MKAIVYTEYGSPEVLKIKEVEKPTPNENEVLIKIHATSVTQGDWKMRKATPFMARLYNGLLKPKRVNILGFELSGIVKEIGSQVKKYKIGDEVFAFTGFGFGAYAEYICLPEAGNHKKGIVSFTPDNMSFEEAATVPGGCLTALSHINKANLKKGDKVLINGASGSVGTFAIQLAKDLGANVTAVCSESNFELVSSLGADCTLDYKKINFTEVNEKYDFVFDVVNNSSKKACRNILKDNGLYESVTASTTIHADILDNIKTLIEKNIIKTVIDQRYSINEIADAHEYVEKGHKKGNVVIKIDFKKGDINEY